LGHPKALALLLSLLLLLAPACATGRGALVKLFREPGEAIRDFPELVWEQYDCSLQQRPFFVVEENELLPDRVRAGGDFSHRLVYAMCPRQRTEVVSGRLLTRIRFRGRPIVRQSEARWEIKPGRWVVDTTVELPESAEPGVYSYELVFQSDSIAFEKHLTFVVRTP
jgi:hypothetical protein